MLFGLEPRDADWYTVWGFLLSAAGVVVSVVGLGATYWQVRQARRAADAARDAAEATRNESRENFRRFLAALVHRQLAEAEGYVTRSQWDFARMRCDDLGTLFAQLSQPVLAKEYRYFANFFRDVATQPSKRFVQSRWDKLVTRSKTHVDLATDPFNAGGVS